MKRILIRPVLLMFVVMLTVGCSSQKTSDVALLHTHLLTSTHQGLVLQRLKGVDAVICMKNLGVSDTLCFRYGEPILDSSGRVIAYKVEKNLMYLEGVQ